jgi:hypothetical protein
MRTACDALFSSVQNKNMHKHEGRCHIPGQVHTGFPNQGATNGCAFQNAGLSSTE